MEDGINPVFLPANTTSTVQPMVQRAISTFKSLKKKFFFKFQVVLCKRFCKAITAIESDFSCGSGQSKLKTSGKDSPLEMPRRTFVTHGKRSK